MSNVTTIVESIEALKHEIENFEPSEHVFHDEFDSMLDETNDPVIIAGMTFTPSQILKECDPIAYKEEFNNYVNGLDLSDIEAYRELTDELAELSAELEEMFAMVIVVAVL